MRPWIRSTHIQCKRYLRYLIKLLNHKVHTSPNSVDNKNWFSNFVKVICIPINNAFWSWHFCDLCQSKGCEMVSHCDFYFNFLVFLVSFKIFQIKTIMLFTGSGFNKNSFYTHIKLSKKIKNIWEIQNGARKRISKNRGDKRR